MDIHQLQHIDWRAIARRRAELRVALGARWREHQDDVFRRHEEMGLRSGPESCLSADQHNERQRLETLRVEHDMLHYVVEATVEKHLEAAKRKTSEEAVLVSQIFMAHKVEGVDVELDPRGRQEVRDKLEVFAVYHRPRMVDTGVREGDVAAEVQALLEDLLEYDKGYGPER